MKITQTSASEATITLTGVEIRILNNALNETLEALSSDSDEFETRVGATIAEVEALLAAINPLARKLE